MIHLKLLRKSHFYLLFKLVIAHKTPLYMRFHGGISERIPQEHRCRHGINLIPDNEILGVGIVDIHLVKIDPSCILACETLNDRTVDPAWLAPRSVCINHYRPMVVWAIPYIIYFCHTLCRCRKRNQRHQKEKKLFHKMISK